jgi:hypothetical protein
MKRLEAADMRIGQSQAINATLEELLSLERDRIKLLLMYRIIPRKPWWWNSEQLGLWPFVVKENCQRDV